MAWPREQQDGGGQLAGEAHRVGGDEDLLAVEPVGPHPGRQGQHRERQELRGADDGHVADLAADRQHRERQHDRGDPVADDREHLAAEQQPVLRLVAQHRRQPKAAPRWRGHDRAAWHGPAAAARQLRC